MRNRSVKRFEDPGKQKEELSLRMFSFSVLDPALCHSQGKVNVKTLESPCGQSWVIPWAEPRGRESRGSFLALFSKQTKQQMEGPSSGRAPEVKALPLDAGSHWELRVVRMWILS